MDVSASLTATLLGFGGLTLLQASGDAGPIRRTVHLWFRDLPRWLGLDLLGLGYCKYFSWALRIAVTDMLGR